MCAIELPQKRMITASMYMPAASDFEKFMVRLEAGLDKYPDMIPIKDVYL